MAEARANMAFGYHRRGDRFQVDAADPRVQGLIKGGYVTLIKGVGDGGPLDDPFDPAGPGSVSGAGVDSGAVQEEEAVDGPDQLEPAAGDPHRA